MRWQMVPVKNVQRLSQAGDSLINRARGLPGMGLIFGFTGAGKTVAATWFVNRCNGVYVRAMANWTPSSMLGSILQELDIIPAGSCYQMAQKIIERLAITGRPLFVDESDYLVQKPRMLETLRDLHDMSTVPVILIGEAGIDRRIAHLQRLTGRIAQSVQFNPCDLEDARSLANALSEVFVHDDLLDHLHRCAKGSTRLIVVGLTAIEHSAKTRGLTEIAEKDWRGGDAFFFGRSGNEPKSGRGRSREGVGA